VNNGFNLTLISFYNGGKTGKNGGGMKNEELKMKN